MSARGKRRPPAFRPISPSRAEVSHHTEQPADVSEPNVPRGLSNQVEVFIDDEKVLLKQPDLEKVRQLGEGQYGLVDAMKHKSSGHILAVKKIRCSMDNAKQRRILNDLDVSMRSSKCPYVIVSYGALYHDGDVWICMEIMDISLDNLYKKVYEHKNTIPENLLAYVTFCVVSALEYLHSALQVIHRDVKPSNILADHRGRIKVCDFGISGDLTNSLAQTNVGSELYLAPERIDSKGQGYRIQSDVWSLGISLLELAMGRFPYRKWPSVFDQLKDVVMKPSPILDPDLPYSPTIRDFTAACLEKKEEARPNYVALLQNPFLTGLEPEQLKEDMAAFVADYVHQD